MEEYLHYNDVCQKQVCRRQKPMIIIRYYFANETSSFVSILYSRILILGNMFNIQHPFRKIDIFSIPWTVKMCVA